MVNAMMYIYINMSSYYYATGKRGDQRFSRDQ